MVVQLRDAPGEADIATKERPLGGEGQIAEADIGFFIAGSDF